MIQTLEATIDTDGSIILHDEIRLHKKYRALVTILDEEPKTDISETALLSEAALAKDWKTAEEDQAWQHLDELPSC